MMDGISMMLQSCVESLEWNMEVNIYSTVLFFILLSDD